MKKHVFIVLFASFLLGGVVSQGDPDWTKYYQYPASVGAEYLVWSPLGNYASNFDVFEAAADIQVPAFTPPSLRPLVRFGLIRFGSRDPLAPLTWTHDNLYVATGLAWAKRFARNFEVGAEAWGGWSRALFQDLAPDMGLVTLDYVIARAGLRLSLAPSYSLSVDLTPGFTWLQSFGGYTGFDGASFNVGFSLHYRFGEDPDAPQATIRSIRFENAEIPPAFSSMQSYYSKNPIGKVTLVNTERQAITDIEVSFDQKGYMDAPTPSFSLPRLDAGASARVPLKAVFNAEVFKLSGGFKPMTGEVIVAYKRGGRPVEQRVAVNYDLYDKTAMTWDDDRKAAAFITTLDSALQNYAAFIGEAGKPSYLAGYNKAIQTTILTYDALRAIGMFYQEDPTAPFTRVQSDPSIVDFISMPRLTLKRHYGDCKNLTVLFCSLLEVRGLHTGFITVPGHIYPVVDTGIPATEWRELSPDRTMSLALGDSLWVPVEVTMLDGRSDFLAVWRQAIDEWKQYEGKRAFYRTSEAQSVFSPVAVEDQDLGLQYGDATALAAYFRHDLEVQTGVVLAGYASAADASRDKKDYNKLGTVAARFGKLSDAEAAFGKALKIDPRYANALVNLANLSFARGDFAKAVDSYQAALTILGSPDKGSLAAGTKVLTLVNLSKAWAAMKNPQKSESYLALASSLDANRVKSLGAIPLGTTGTRASIATDALSSINYAEDN
ncbi:MAG TPA: tetratricopeptide repeat protein [Rectinemataceae bacterium]|nr:tetratricopeptide repeat protein [Rectinemataceae bacterium]